MLGQVIKKKKSITKINWTWNACDGKQELSHFWPSQEFYAPGSAACTPPQMDQIQKSPGHCGL